MDTLRLLYEVETFPPFRVGVDVAGTSWVLDPMPGLGLLAVEGNPLGGALWSPEGLHDAGDQVRELVNDTFTLRRGRRQNERAQPTGERGVARADLTTSRRFRPVEGRAFLAGMAALDFPRLETTRRGTPVHSVWWTGERSAVIRGRTYDEAFKIDTRESFERIRLEDQRRFPNGQRPTLDEMCNPQFQAQLFEKRWNPMRKAVNGIKAASFPVIAHSIADEFRYGYRGLRESERLAASLVLLTGGAGEGYARSTYYKRRAELREAGYVAVDDFLEPVEVDLGRELEQALDEFGR